MNISWLALTKLALTHLPTVFSLIGATIGDLAAVPSLIAVAEGTLSAQDWAVQNQAFVATVLADASAAITADPTFLPQLFTTLGLPVASPAPPPA